MKIRLYAPPKKQGVATGDSEARTQKDFPNSFSLLMLIQFTYILHYFEHLSSLKDKRLDFSMKVKVDLPAASVG
jgi:hypothetical protein